MYKIGLDEVARGPLFGPIFAGAVVLNDDTPNHKWLKDSKKTTKKRRAVVREWIENEALYWSVAQVNTKTIDIINIRNANKLVMELAIRKLINEMSHDEIDLQKIKLLVDGIDFNGTTHFGQYDDSEFMKDVDVYIPPMLACDIEHQNVIKGDQLFPCISAASVLAKEHHDDYIKDLIARDPTLDSKYGLSTNMGYGTKRHIDGLKEFGVTSNHRMSFLKCLK